MIVKKLEVVLISIKRRLNSEDLYYKEVFAYPKLNHQEIKASLKKIKQGDQAAKEYFLLTQQRLVIHIVNQFSYIDGLEKMDLIQEANYGLIEAIDSYDLSRGVCFSSYAYPIIYSKVIDAINNQMDLIKVSRHIKHKGKYYPQVYLSVDDKHPLNREATYKDYPTMDINSPIKQYLSNERSKMIQQFLSKLNPRSKKIVVLYFGLFGNRRHTYQEIADKFNLSKVGVYKHIKAQLSKAKDLKAYFTKCMDA
mgnify:CR=1 FL=1